MSFQKEYQLAGCCSTSRCFLGRILKTLPLYTRYVHSAKSDVSGMVSVHSNESELTSESGFDESGATLVGSN